MRCPNCGNENPDDYTFCDECGARLTPQNGEAEAVSAPGEPAYAAASPGEPQPVQAVTTTSQSTETQAAPESLPASSGAVCPSCGAPIVPGEAYCNECGAELPAGGAAYAGTGAAEAPTMAPYTPPGDESMAAAAPGVPDGRSREVPLTEDTAQPAATSVATPAAPPYAETAQPSMPGVVPVAAEQESQPVAVEEPQAAPQAGPGNYEWAHEALSQLEHAQQSMANGDWISYGQAMNDLKAFLQNVAQGASPAVSGAVAGIGAPVQQPEYAAPAPAPIQPEPMATAPEVEPAAEAGTMGAVPTPQRSAAPGQARLVVISSGAELPLPQQEEITVGREDPSSGIFPDVDLTPYGGEDGGVSRRHARLLHVGNDYFVEDLQSTNYTKVDGQRLPARVREKLEDGARLDFGRVAVIFRRS